MQQVYQTHLLRPQSVMQRLLKQPVVENSVIELNNFLAEQGPEQLTEEVVYAIQRKYKIDFLNEFKTNVLELYTAYYMQCADSGRDAVTKPILTQMRNVMKVDENTAEKIHIHFGSIIYTQYALKIVSTGEITVVDQGVLDKRTEELMLPKEKANSILLAVSKEYLQHILQSLLKNGMVSTDEFEMFTIVQKKLRVPNEELKEAYQVLHRYRLYGDILTNELQSVFTELPLQKNEICYFSKQSKWYEPRGSFLPSSITILKHAVTSTSRHAPEKVNTGDLTNSNWKLLDGGNMLITNKRIILSGTNKTTSIRLERIEAIYPFVNGVYVKKDAGKSPFVEISLDSDLATLILKKLIVANASAI